MWFLVAEVGRAANHARAPKAPPRRYAASRSCQTPLAFSGIVQELMGPSQIAALLCQMCSLSKDI